MARLAVRRLRGRDHARDPEVAVCRRRRTDADRPVCQPNVKRVGVRGRVDGYGLDPELVERPNHAHRDLTTVRNEDSGEHG